MVLRKEAVLSTLLGLGGVAAVALASAGGGHTNCKACYTLNNIEVCHYSVRNCSSAEVCVGTGGVNPDGSVWVLAECRNRNSFTP